MSRPRILLNLPPLLEGWELLTNDIDTNTGAMEAVYRREGFKLKVRAPERGMYEWEITTHISGSEVRAKGPSMEIAERKMLQGLQKIQREAEDAIMDIESWHQN